MPDFQFRSIDSGRYRRATSDPRADFRWRAELLEPIDPTPLLESVGGAITSPTDPALEPHPGQIVDLGAKHPVSQDDINAEPSDRSTIAGQ